MKSFIFITGRGRSGSWLLKSILDQHPKISVAPEALFILSLFNKYKNKSNWSSTDLTKFYENLIQEPKLEKWWKIDFDSLKQSILAMPANSKFQDLCLLPYLQYAAEQEKEECEIIADKNPEYSLHIDRLAALYPAAKFIFLCRDPRDNVSSYKKVNFDSNNTTALAYRWKYYNSHLLKMKAKYAKQVFLLKYEDLLQNPENSLSALCSFLSVNYREDLLDFYKNPKNVLPWNERITTPIDPKLAYKWKQQTKQLERENAIISSICKLELKALGYEEYQAAESSSDWLGLSTGKLLSKIEQNFFSLPFALRNTILKAYRKETKVLPD